jgi:SecD/SecF fusion protein
MPAPATSREQLIRLLAVIFIPVVAGLFFAYSKGLKLGIDLSGGTILVYQAKEGTRSDSFKMDDLIAALKRRVNPEGLVDVPIRKIGNNRIEIILPEAKPEVVEEVKNRLTTVGSLEFRILANQKHDAAAIRRALDSKGLANPPKGYNWAVLGELVEGTNPERLSSTRILDTTKNWLRDRYAQNEIVLTGKDSSGKETSEANIIESNTSDTLTLRKSTKLTTISSYRFDFNPSKIQNSAESIVREERRPNGVTERHILYVEDKQKVTGEYLAHTYPTQDERIQPAVGFTFNGVGARKFGKLTSDHLPEENGAFKYRLAILLDTLVMSAPSINSAIRESGIIEGVPPKEVNSLIEILRSGSLPASVNPTPLLEEKIGPTLGKDTIDKGVNAILVSMIIVPVFMIFYYRFAGVVSVVALIMNMILLIGSMAFFESSFTLPGLAGLALTIGMAVDANVLVFERMREEAERGASMVQQIRNGFNRAWATIFDAHVTTLLSGVVLYAIGTEEIKGFALSLILGMIWNLFTAVYVSRVIFEFWYSQGWLKKLTMIKFMDRTNIDFIGPRRYFMIGSLIVIIAGLAVFIVRRNEKFNIDFTGGTLVTIQLDDKAPEIKDLSEGQRASFVRKKAGAVLLDPAVETLNVGSESRGVRFNIRTTEDKTDDVQKKIVKEFGPSLSRLEMTIASSKPIAEAKSLAADVAKDKDKEKEKAKESSKAEPPPARFAGGHIYDLTFNRSIEPETVRNEYTRILTTQSITTPQSRFEVIQPRVAATAANKPPFHLSLATDLEPKQADAALTNLAAALRDNPTLLFERVENFGGAVAGETRTLALMAIVASWLIIIAYVWFRFRNLTYGMAAVLALVHDVLVTLGAVALSSYKIDLPMVAAFLTLVGFSTNDTIVIFDRIREIKGKSPNLTPEIVNAAVNQTLSRTILTSLTAWIVVVIMYFFGGEGLEGFSFCLVIGFLSGTYSTVYIASPILIDWIGKTETKTTTKQPQMAAR